MNEKPVEQNIPRVMPLSPQAASSFPNMNPFFTRLNVLQQQAFTLPYMYPHLYQSLVSMCNVNKLRMMTQGAIFPKTPPDPSAASSALPAWVTDVKRPRPPDSTGKDSTKSEPSPRRSKEPPTKKARYARKLQFDDETVSPVSGMFIRDASEPGKGSGDIAASLNLVEVTEEARIEIEKIPNVIGDYICQLCKVKFDDAFQLAAHSCPRIGHVEYRCPECNKVFNCPANLASHQRWHKPWKHSDRNDNIIALKRLAQCNGEGVATAEQCPLDLSAVRHGSDSTSESDQEMEDDLECRVCGRKFLRHAYLRRHAISHSPFASGNADDVQCDKCVYWFPNTLLLDKHVHFNH